MTGGRLDVATQRYRRARDFCSGYERSRDCNSPEMITRVYKYMYELVDCGWAFDFSTYRGELFPRRHVVRASVQIIGCGGASGATLGGHVLPLFEITRSARLC